MNESAMEILLVEDDPIDLELTLRELRKGPPCRIVVAHDGEEALDFLFCRGDSANRSPSQPPHLVLLDLKLPKVNGLQVLQAIKATPQTQAIPVVALTSSREEKDLVECYRLGVNGYVQKPVEFEQFREAIRALSFYWIGVNQPPPQRAFLSR